MKHQVSTYLDNAITFILLLVAGFTPLLFLNQTTEFFEMPKLIFLVATTLILVGLWIASWIFKGKVIITRTPLDILLLVLAGLIIASTFFSTTRFISVFGNIPNVHGSAVAWLTYILLYFVAVSHLKSLARLRGFLSVLYGSAIIVALITILSFFNLYLPFDFAQVANFTPTGSTFSTIAFLLLLLPLPLFSLLNPNRFFSLPISLFLSILFTLTISLVGSLTIYIILAAVFALSIYATKPYQVRKALPLFILPVIVTAVTLFLAYAPLPQPLNVIQQKELNFPKEIQLPFPISWKITASAFRDVPFLGTGPSTYLFDFSIYKPLEFNSLAYWNFSFNTAYNEFLQVLATLGILGFSAIVFICLVVLRLGWKNLKPVASEGEQDSTTVLLPAIAISGFLTVALLAVHATTVISIVITFFIFAILMLSQRTIREKVTEFSLGIRAATPGNQQFDLFPVIIFVIFLIGAIPAFYQLVMFVSADYYHRQALAQANKNGTLTYQYLQKAESLNPQVDLYRVDMAQTNFAIANAIAIQKGPTQANPKGSLTDQDKQTIQTLLSQAVSEGRSAVVLSPRSSQNWGVLGSIYRGISGVAQNALAFSLEADSQAIQRDPLNPALRLNAGNIYYAAQNYDLAIRFFTDAINLKPDYVNAYYNLAIALREKGDLQDAQLVTKQLVTLIQKTGDANSLKAAKALLDDVNARIAKTSTAPSAQTPQGQNASALENPNLPAVNVSNLKNPPQVTPAPAVKSNPSAKVPQPTPTVSQ